MSAKLPENIKPLWFSLIQRLQGCAKKQNGLAIIRITILVNANGDPIKWGDPHMTRLEPLSNDNSFLDLLSGLE